MFDKRIPVWGGSYTRVSCILDKVQVDQSIKGGYLSGRNKRMG